MGIFVRICYIDVSQFQVQILVHRVQCSAYAVIVKLCYDGLGFDVQNIT